MNLAELFLQARPVLLALAIVLTVIYSTKRQRIAVLLAWLFPGLGHLWLGEKRRGLLFMVVLVTIFLAGLALGGFDTVSPFDRHPIWAMAQIPGGLMMLFGWLVSGKVEITQVYNIACLYTATACLLNLVAMCDVWDLAGEGEENRVSGDQDLAAQKETS